MPAPKSIPATPTIASRLPSPDAATDTCELLQVILESCGAQVKTASSAVAALEAIAKEAFDVLISDIGMPEEDGYALIAKVRALDEERGGGIPAAALTAYAREQDHIRTLRSGFQIHVPKPISCNSHDSI